MNDAILQQVDAYFGVLFDPILFWSAY